MKNKRADFFAVGLLITAIIVYGFAITILSQITEVSVKPIPSDKFLDTYKNLDNYFGASVDCSACFTLSDLKNILAESKDCKIVDNAFSTGCFHSLRERWFDHLINLTQEQLDQLNSSTNNTKTLCSMDENTIKCSINLSSIIKGNTDYEISRALNLHYDLTKSRCFNISKEVFNINITDPNLNMEHWSVEKQSSIITLTSKPFLNGFALEPIILKIALT